MKTNLLVLFCVLACLTLVSAVSGTLVVDFSADQVTGEAPFEISFTGVSVNATSWEWNFGDGSAASTDQNPSHTYSDAGTYTVSLTVTNDTDSGTEEKTDYITITEPEITPIAGFTSSTTSGDAPLLINFTDSSEDATSWSWNFGDGSAASTDQNPSHTFSTVGTFIVIQTVTNATSGLTDTSPVTITVSNPLESIFTSSATSGTVPLNITFTDASTPSSQITSHSWNFGDGSTSTDQHPAHNFTSAGEYNVTLTVSDGTYSDTSFSIITVNAAVTVIAPVAAFSANVTSGSAPLAVLFTDSSTNSPTSWSWEVVGETTNTSRNLTYIFDTEGIYTIILEVENSAGSNSSTKTNYITVGNVPTASFTTNVTSGTYPLAVFFNDTSTGNISSRSWSFGDGSTSSSDNLNRTHTYSSAGNYTVTLMVNNSVGGTIATKNITVTSPQATATPTPTPTSTQTPTPAPTYAGTSYEADATGLTAVAENVSESDDDGGILFHNPLTEEIWKFYSFYLEYMKYLKGTVGITGEASNSS